MLTAYPEGEEALLDERAESEMQAVIELISRVRNIRSEMNIKPSERVRVVVSSADEALRNVLTASGDQIKRLARASELEVGEGAQAPRASARAVLAGGAEVAVPLEGLIDFAQEQARLEREREKLQKEAGRLEAQLANPQFVERAPAEKVSEIRERLEDIARRTQLLRQNMEALR
jgi:valyl-tRNA synthetase